MKAIGALLLIALVIFLIWMSIAGFVDCWSTSPAGSFFGKMADCGSG